MSKSLPSTLFLMTAVLMAAPSCLATEEHSTRAGDPCHQQLLPSAATHLQEDWMPESLHPGAAASPTEAAAHWREIEEHNAHILLANNRRLQALLPSMASLEPAVVIPRLYSELVRGWIFPHVPRDLYSPESQRRLRDQVLRGQNSRIALLMNMVPPHPIHVDEVLEAFHSKLESLMQSISTRASVGLRQQQALRVAVWAKTVLTTIQAGSDANTRAGRAVFNYVLARIRLLHGIDLPLLDFNLGELREAAIEYERNGHKFPAFQPFTDGLKDQINTRMQNGLAVFARKHQRYYLYLSSLNNPEALPDPSWSIVIDPTEPHDPNHPESPTLLEHYAIDPTMPGWTTQRDYLLEQIKIADQQSIAEDEALEAETNWLLAYLRIEIIDQNEASVRTYLRDIHRTELLREYLRGR